MLVFGLVLPEGAVPRQERPKTKVNKKNGEKGRQHERALSQVRDGATRITRAPGLLPGLGKNISWPILPAYSPPQQLEEHAAQREPVSAAVIGHTLLQDLWGHVPVGAPVRAQMS